MPGKDGRIVRDGGTENDEIGGRVEFGKRGDRGKERDVSCRFVSSRLCCSLLISSRLFSFRCFSSVPFSSRLFSALLVFARRLEIVGGEGAVRDKEMGGSG